MEIKRLSLEEFNRIAAQLAVEAVKPLATQTIEMVRSVLVDGRSQTAVAIEYGMSKQRVSLAVRSFTRQYVRSGSLGKAMVRVSLELPELLAVEFSELSKAILDCHNLDEVNKAVASVYQSLKLATQRVNAASKKKSKP